MKGLVYQLKSVWKDKFCIMSFLLPIIVAFALNFIGTIDLSSTSEFHFGVLENDLSAETTLWLERYGSVTTYKTWEELADAVNEPSTNLIGVEAGGRGIKTIISGDELDLFRQAADTLPALYEGRADAERTNVTILERPDIMAGLQNIFTAMTLIVAMFMGCTFNAMNTFLMLALIVLSAFVAALIGLFIGKFSENLMVGVVYVKIIMIVFMAVPLLSYLLGADGLALTLCYFVPSNATFEGVMNLANSTEGVIAKDMLILMAHCIVWFLLYLLISKRQK